jgi:hypothetical protein
MYPHDNETPGTGGGNRPAGDSFASRGLSGESTHRWMRRARRTQGETSRHAFRTGRKWEGGWRCQTALVVRVPGACAGSRGLRPWLRSWRCSRASHDSPLLARHPLLSSGWDGVVVIGIVPGVLLAGRRLVHGDLDGRDDVLLAAARRLVGHPSDPTGVHRCHAKESRRSSSRRHHCRARTWCRTASRGSVQSGRGPRCFAIGVPRIHRLHLHLGQQCRHTACRPTLPSNRATS